MEDNQTNMKNRALMALASAGIAAAVAFATNIAKSDLARDAWEYLVFRAKTIENKYE